MSEAVLSPWLRVAEIAAYTQQTKGQVFRACASRALEHVRVGGRGTIVAKREWCDSWLLAQRVHVVPGGAK